MAHLPSCACYNCGLERGVADTEARYKALVEAARKHYEELPMDVLAALRALHEKAEP